MRYGSAALVVGLLAASPASQGADVSFYGGISGGVVESRAKLSVPGSCLEVCIPELPDVPASSGTDSSSDRAFKLVGGIRFGRYAGLEVAYTDVESSTYSVLHTNGWFRQDQDSDLSSLSIQLVGYLPVRPNIDLYARAGSTRAELSGEIRTELLAMTFLPGIPFAPIIIPPVEFDRHDVGFAYAAGAQARFGRLGFRLEYEGYDVSLLEKTDLVTLGATWTFQ